MTIPADKLRSWLDAIQDVEQRYPHDEDMQRRMRELSRVADEIRAEWAKAIVEEGRP